MFHNAFGRFRADKRYEANLFKKKHTISQGREIFSSRQYNARWFPYFTHFDGNILVNALSSNIPYKYTAYLQNAKTI